MIWVVSRPSKKVGKVRRKPWRSVGRCSFVVLMTEVLSSFGLPRKEV